MRISIPIYSKIWWEGSVYQNDNGEHKAIMRLMANDQGNIKILEEHKDIKVVFKSELNDKETS